MTGPPAGSTDPAKVDVVVTYLEPMPANIRPQQLVQALLLQIDDVVATQADQMMMLICLGIEPRGRARVADFGDYAKLHEAIQDAVDRCSRDRGQQLPNLIVDLVGCGVVFSIKDVLQNRASLRRHRPAPLAACPLKLLDPLLFRLFGHG